MFSLVATVYFHLLCMQYKLYYFLITTIRHRNIMTVGLFLKYHLVLLYEFNIPL